MDFTLEFERPVSELENQIRELRQTTNKNIDISHEIAALEAELQALINAQEALGADEGKEGRAVLEEKQDALEVQANAIQEKLDALLESFESPDPGQLAVVIPAFLLLRWLERWKIGPQIRWSASAFAIVAGLYWFVERAFLTA